MTLEDRKEVVEIIGLAITPVVEAINQRFDKLDLINDSLIQGVEQNRKAIKILAKELKNQKEDLKNQKEDLKNQREDLKNQREDLKNQREDFKKAMKEQSNTFLKVLEAYEKRADRHEKNFQQIKNVIDTESEEMS